MWTILMEALEIKLNKMFLELNKSCYIYINDLNNQQKVLYKENNIKSNYFYLFLFFKIIQNLIKFKHLLKHQNIDEIVA